MKSMHHMAAVSVCRMFVVIDWHVSNHRMLCDADECKCLVSTHWSCWILFCVGSSRYMRREQWLPCKVSSCSPSGNQENQKCLLQSEKAMRCTHICHMQSWDDSRLFNQLHFAPVKRQTSNIFSIFRSYRNFLGTKETSLLLMAMFLLAVFYHGQQVRRRQLRRFHRPWNLIHLKRSPENDPLNITRR